MSISREHALSSVGAGWADLVNELYDELPNGAIVSDVKEKFGTLRFYVSNCSEEYQQFVDTIEELSRITCEACGEKGETRFDLSWYKTLCDNCYDNEIGYLEINE